jgi:hypothetical protein
MNCTKFDENDRPDKTERGRPTRWFDNSSHATPHRECVGAADASFHIQANQAEISFVRLVYPLDLIRYIGFPRGAGMSNSSIMQNQGIPHIPDSVISDIPHLPFRRTHDLRSNVNNTFTFKHISPSTKWLDHNPTSIECKLIRLKKGFFCIFQYFIIPEYPLYTISEYHSLRLSYRHPLYGIKNARGQPILG